VGLKEYEVTVPGRSNHKTTLLLSDEEAKRLGVAEKQPPAAPEGKGRKVSNKAGKPAANK